MKINFTKSQYDTLIKLVQYGYWITSDSENNEKFSELEQYLNSYAMDFDVKGIEYVKEYGIYDLSRELEEEIHEVIDQYEEGVFLDKLAYYMARKEFAKESKLKELNQEEAFQRILELEEKYHLYIEENGLDHLKIEK
ncbi:hypothetical protein ACQKL5_14520 [Peribacillus sp. NPDC097675]|uniref:hypothetical protein n=1 Tax=Peribacillus sp. NPDC097675 TaxID=3390618 RepID=UPI003CFD5962